MSLSVNAMVKWPFATPDNRIFMLTRLQLLNMCTRTGLTQHILNKTLIVFLMDRPNYIETCASPVNVTLNIMFDIVKTLESSIQCRKVEKKMIDAYDPSVHFLETLHN